MIIIYLEESRWRPGDTTASGLSSSGKFEIQFIWRGTSCQLFLKWVHAKWSFCKVPWIYSLLTFTIYNSFISSIYSVFERGLVHTMGWFIIFEINDHMTVRLLKNTCCLIFIQKKWASDFFKTQKVILSYCKAISGCQIVKYTNDKLPAIRITMWTNVENASQDNTNYKVPQCVAIGHGAIQEKWRSIYYRMSCGHTANYLSLNCII